MYPRKYVPMIFNVFVELTATLRVKVKIIPFTIKKRRRNNKVHFESSLCVLYKKNRHLIKKTNTCKNVNKPRKLGRKRFVFSEFRTSIGKNGNLRGSLRCPSVFEDLLSQQRVQVSI